MSSKDMAVSALTMTATQTRPAERLVRVAMLGAIGAALAAAESAFPHPVPWVRLGVGNAAVLVALWSDGVWAALAVLLLKLGLAGLIGGTLAQPTMIVAGFAGGAAWATMSLFHGASDALRIGPIGVSIAGALAYGLAQVWLVSVWLVQSSLWTWAPLIVGPGVLAGGVTGLLAALVLRRLGCWVPWEGKGGQSR